MSARVLLQQHIRTSSQVRRGFRTYQCTPPMDEATDSKLGAYGEYSRTVYPNVRTMEAAEYPELFIFYHLNSGVKVFCKSLYIGQDLHSYPPRSGNYIAQSLLYNGHEYLNPAEVYEKATWKTPAQVADEDKPGLPFEIPLMELVTASDFLNAGWFEGLLGTDAPPARREMFKAAVDGIIQGRQVIIIDQKEMLLLWTMTLLQVFPKKFVFERLTITSFANSNLLVDICKVLCCERETADRVKRYAKDALIVDYYELQVAPASVYADVLLNRIVLGDFKTFSAKIFPEINALNDYSPEGFDRPALFYDKLRKIDGDMSPVDFSTFFGKFLNDRTAVDEIFGEIRKKELAWMCPLMWKAFVENKTIDPADLTHYKHIYQYKIPGLTDELWWNFEATLTRTLIFKEVKEVNNFFNVTGREVHASRKTLYYDVMSGVIRKYCTTADAIARGTQSLREALIQPIEVQEMAIREMDAFGEILTKMGTATTGEKYRLCLEYLPQLVSWQRASIIKVLPTLNWDHFFSLLKTDKTLLKELYNTIEFNGLLPQSELAGLIISGTYPEHEDKLYQLYRQLWDNDMDLFVAHAPADILEIIVFKEPGITPDKPEDILQRFAGKMSPAKLLSMLINRAKQASSVTGLWKICSIVFEPDKFRNNHPGIIGKLLSADIEPVYEFIDDVSYDIPPGFEKLAALLSDKRHLKREVPRSELFATLNTQRQEIRKALAGGKKLDHHMLAALIKVPWLFYSWQQLFDELDPEQQERLPAILNDMLKMVYSYQKGYLDYSISRWNAIVCQYFVFLIVSDKRAHFVRLTEKMAIDWDDYNQINLMLQLTLLSGNNETYQLFLEPSRGIGRSMNKRPQWKHKYA